MSENRLSLIHPGPMDLSTATALASEFIARRKAHFGGVDFQMTAPIEGKPDEDPDDQGSSAGGAGGDAKPDEGAGTTDGSGDPNKKISALEEEKDRHYQARKAAEEELARYKAAEEEQQRAANDEVTNLKNDLAKAEQTLAETQAALDAALLDNAFLTENTHQWQNPARVLKLVDRDAVRIEDGKVVGVKEALEALAKTDPYLLKPKDETSSPNGGPTGPSHHQKKSDPKGQPSREELARKYPALRR